MCAIAPRALCTVWASQAAKLAADAQRGGREETVASDDVFAHQMRRGRRRAVGVAVAARLRTTCSRQ